MNRVLLTRNGYEKLNEECSRLRAERAEVSERVRQSLEFGGVSVGNGDYMYAHQELELIEQRLAEYERRLVDADVVATRRDGVVDIGETVTVHDLDGGQVIEYQIVGTGESDPPAGAVSYQSPVGRALLGRREGDLVEVETPSGCFWLKILGLDE